MQALADAASKNTDFSGLAMFKAEDDILVLGWKARELKAAHEETNDTATTARTSGEVTLMVDLRVVWYSTFQKL